MKRIIWLSGILAACLFAPNSVQAGSGFYLSSELGANFAPSLDTKGSGNDRASVCDEFINPLFATVTQTPGYSASGCWG